MEVITNRTCTQTAAPELLSKARQTSARTTDEAAAVGLPDEHMRHAPAVLSSTHRMAAADRMQAHTAQSSPRASPPDPLSRLVSRSAAAVAPLKPQRPLVQPHGSAEGLLVARAWVLVF